MTDNVGPLEPTPPTGPVRPRGGQGGGQPPARGRGITGHVVAVQDAAHHDGRHLLDVSVGAPQHVELTIRVESGDCRDIEGHRVVVYVTEEFPRPGMEA